MGARGEHFPGLSRQWAWSELSVHVTADSFAVKSWYCVPPLREARPNEGEQVSTRKECATTTFMDENPHHTHAHTHTHKGCGNCGKIIRVFFFLRKRKKTHLRFKFRKYEIFGSAVTLGPLGRNNVV